MESDSVEKPDEKSKNQWQSRVRVLEQPVGDLDVELALERVYMDLACERAGIADVAGV